MNITFDPTNPTEHKIVSAFLKLCGVQDTAPAVEHTPVLQAPQVEAVVPVKRGRKPRVDPAAETEALPKAESVTVVEPQPSTSAPSTTPAHAPVEPAVSAADGAIKDASAPGAGNPTKEELIAAFQGMVAKYGKESATEKARRILSGLGAANVSGVPEDKRGLALAAVKAEMAEAAKTASL